MRHGAHVKSAPFFVMLLWVVAVLSNGAIAQSDGPPSEHQLTNLAWHRPCTPLPYCSLLVGGHDENLRVSARTKSASGSSEELSKDVALPARTFKVFLPLAAFVDRLVLHCVRTGDTDNLQRSNTFQPPPDLRVTLWPDGDDSGPDRGAGIGKSQPRRAETFTTEPSQHDEHDNFRLEIQLKKIASVVSLEVQPPAGIKGPALLRWLSEGGSFCGGRLPVAEIAVLGRPRISEGLQVPLTPAPARRQAVDIPSLRSAASPLLPKSHLQLQSGVKVAQAGAFLKRTLPEDFFSTVSSWSTWYAFTSFVSFVSLSIFLIAWIFFRRAAKLSEGTILRGHMRAEVSQSEPIRPAFFYIGDDDEAVPPTPTSNLVGSASEPEPEAELEPPSCPSTPARSPRVGAAPAPASFGGELPGVQPVPLTCGGGDMGGKPGSSLPLLPQPSVVAPATPVAAAGVQQCGMRALAARAGQWRPHGEKQIAMLFAAPLCYEDPVRGLKTLPQTAFDVEWGILVQAHEEAASALLPFRARSSRLRPVASLVPRPLTASNLQRAVAPSVAGGASTVLHLSAHGIGDGLILENGKRPCTAHPLSGDQLSAMLDLRKGVTDSSGLRLVILNACSSRAVGLRFVRCGVPHVVCALAEIKDSWGHLFLHRLYSGFFQGETVAAAFQAALVTLRSNHDVPGSAADAFCLLPEEDAHDEILFPVSSAGATTFRGVVDRDKAYSSRADVCDDGGMASDMETESQKPQKQVRRCLHPKFPTPFDRAVPPLPEDFIGRSKDSWTLQQYLVSRRVVVVCGGSSVGQGIGKSALMDSVQRALTLQLGATCVAVRLKDQGLLCENPGCQCWISHMTAAVQRAISDMSRGDSFSMFRRCVVSRRCTHQSRQSAVQPTSSDSCTCFPATTVVDTALEPLVSAMQALGRLSRDQGFGGEWWPAVAANGPFAGGPAAGEGGALIILHDCDHLVQQQFFQETIADILRRCPGYRILLSTQRSVAMVGSSWCQFKAVHHAVEGLMPTDAARLFLRRTHRAIRWEELLPAKVVIESGRQPRGQVVLTQQSEAEVLRLVAEHPAVAAQHGNPRALIELAGKVDVALASLGDLGSDTLVVPADTLTGSAQSEALRPPKQGTMAPMVAARDRTSMCSSQYATSVADEAAGLQPIQVK